MDKICVWRLEDPHCDTWESDCGMSLLFNNEEGPRVNNFEYCPGCGKPLSEKIARPICGHAHKGHVCNLDGGHIGIHNETKSVGPGDFQLHEWNDQEQERTSELGEAFTCNYDDAADCRRAKEQAIADARKLFEPGTVFEIRAKLYPGDRTTDYGTKKITRDEAAKDWGIAWYLVPKQPKGFEHLETATEPLVDYEYDQGEHIEAGGYILLARIKA